MPNYSKKIVYLSKAQYQELITNNSVTVNGVTVTYNENDIYVTPQAEPITDVKINGTSIGNNGVANIPLGSTSNFGVFKIHTDYGINATDGYLHLRPATEESIKGGTVNHFPITAGRQHIATFYGLSKIAGADLANETVTLGTYPDASKAAIQNMLGITNLLSTEESSTATAAHALNSTFMMNGKLHRATAAIAIGDAVEVGTNCEVVKADEVFVKKTDIATNNTAGLIKVSPTYGLRLSSGTIVINETSSSSIKSGTWPYAVISPEKQHESVFYGLSKIAGVDLANETVTLGTYPESSKLAINNMLGAVSKDSLDNAGITARTYSTKFGGEFSVTTAVSQDYISPYARASVTGRISKANMHRVTVNGTTYVLPTRLWYMPENAGIKVYEYLGNLGLYVSDINGVPGGTDNVPFIIISDLDNSNSIDVLTQTAGTYTILVEQINETKKDLPKSLIYGDSYVPIEKNNNGGTYNGFSIGVNELNNKRATFAFGYGNKINNEFSYAIGRLNEVSAVTSIAIGTRNVIDSSGSGGFAIGYGNNISGNGAVAIGDGLEANGGLMVAVGSANAQAIKTFPAFQTNTAYKKGDIIKNVASQNVPLEIVMYCLKDHISSGSYPLDYKDENNKYYWRASPSDGDTLFVVGNGKNSYKSNALKVTTGGNVLINGNLFVDCEPDSTGGTMLPKDVQINGTSIVSNGVANIPYASILTAGAVKVTGVGIGIYGSDHGALEGALYLVTANSEQIKSGNNTMPINSAFQHEAVYYGLSKLAGVNLANETVTVGTYPETSKEAIQTMLGTQAAIEVIRL